MAESVSAALVEKRQEFATKQKELNEVMELAQDGKVFDLSRKNVLDKLGATDAADALAKVKARNVELENLGGELEQHELKYIKTSINERDDARSQPINGNGVRHAEGIDTSVKSFGERYTETKEYADFRKGAVRDHVADLENVSLKTLFETGAGWAPQSVRTGRLVEGRTRPILVLDLIPSAPISDPVEKYMEETTRTHSSAEKAEGVAYAESTFVWTEQTSNVRKITDSIPVTDEQLEDEAQVAGILDQRLRFGLMQRLDGQVLVGDGAAPNLKGVNNVAGVQTQAKGADATIVAFMKALTLIRFTGRANPNGAVMHPNDWQDILLTQTANGDFLFGNPFTGPGPQSLFGIPVAVSDAQTQNTGLVGDFANFCRIGEKRGVQVEVGYVNTQFTDGKRTLRASLRACFTVYRPTAFCQITGI